MIPKRFATTAITVVRAPLVDDGHGNAEPDWPNATETLIPGWSVQPYGERKGEVTVNRDAVSDRLVALGPAEVDVLATDRVKVRGDTYEIDGEPHRWHDTGTSLDHTELLLERWEG